MRTGRCAARFCRHVGDMPRLAFSVGAVAGLTLASALFAAEPAARFSSPLPDPLAAPDGKRITTAEQWMNEQRPRVLELFRTHVYGHMPKGPQKITPEVQEKNTPAFDGKATRKRVRIGYAGTGGAGQIDVTIYTPKAKAPTGIFILIVNRAKEIMSDAETKPQEYWPVENLISRGYATAAFHYSDTAMDNKDTAFAGGALKAFGPTPRTADSWGALGAWAWGASRIVDYLETDAELKGKRVAVIGQSRGGKASLWCGAQDPRIALTISNDSGQGGAALSRRKQGETVEVITRVFPHWFAQNYRNYADKEETLPVDQHMLLALVAPRLVYVASAHDDAWADPRAEFGSCVEAGPVYKLFGLAGVGEPTQPADNAPRHVGAIGYHVRPGAHNLLHTDWTFYLDFADRHWKK